MMLSTTNAHTSCSPEEEEKTQIFSSKEHRVNAMEKTALPEVAMEEQESAFGQVVDAKTILKKKSYKLNHDSDSPTSSSSPSSSSSESASRSPARLSSRLCRRVKKGATAASCTSAPQSEMGLDKEMNCDVPPEEAAGRKKKRFDVWSSLLQVDTLMEDMRGINVTRNFNDRAVENYDFNLAHRLNRERFGQFDDAEDPKDFQSELKACKKRLDRKRAHSKSRMNEDDHDDDQLLHPSKMSRQNPEKHLTKSAARKLRRQQRTASGRRTNHQSSGGHDDSDNQKSESDCESRRSRHIEDMSDVSNRAVSDIAMEMATKLHEKNLDLMVKIVEVMGVERSLKVFEETQRIEAKGGMDIHSGARRRTSGGIFMLLVRLHDDLTPEEKKSIFKSDTKPQNTPNPFREELKEHEAIKFTSMSNSQEQDAMEEGECSPESNKAQDDYLPNPPPSPNYPFN